jgi:hypothetical protein
LVHSPSSPRHRRSRCGTGAAGSAVAILAVGASQDQVQEASAPERRELLYTAVRDAMVRAGVLSAGYKFKVLSLDQRGRQFLVMMDLAPEYGGDMDRLGEIEALIARPPRRWYRRAGRVGALMRRSWWAPRAPGVAGAPAQAACPNSRQGPLRPRRSWSLRGPPRARAAHARPHWCRRRCRKWRRAAALRPHRGRRGRGLQAGAGECRRRAPRPRGARRGHAQRPLPPQPALTGFEDTVMPSQEGRSPDLSSAVRICAENGGLNGRRSPPA